MTTAARTAYSYRAEIGSQRRCLKCEKAQKSSGFRATGTYSDCIKDYVLIDRVDFDGIMATVKALLGTSDGAFINRPFYCDYGSHIHVGKNFFANYNCAIIDVTPVTIGDNCQMAPNVAIYTAGYPVHPVARNTAYEYGIEVTIGHNVWIGDNSVILPGVHIGAGSVVTKDVPAWCVAAGNPCRVIRRITEDDRETWFRHAPVDPESLEHMRRMWAESDDAVKYPTAPEENG